MVYGIGYSRIDWMQPVPQLPCQILQKTGQFVKWVCPEMVYTICIPQNPGVFSHHIPTIPLSEVNIPFSDVTLSFVEGRKSTLW